MSMSKNDPAGSTTEKQPGRRQWPLKTLIEILPVVIALTVFFSYSTIKNVTDVALVTPLQEVLGGVPFWVVGLMSLIVVFTFLGMGWLIYIFSRAPINPDGSREE